MCCCTSATVLSYSKGMAMSSAWGTAACVVPTGSSSAPPFPAIIQKIDLSPSARPGAAVTGLPPPPAVNGGGSATATAVRSGPGRPRVCALAQLSAIIPITPPSLLDSIDRAWTRLSRDFTLLPHGRDHPCSWSCLHCIDWVLRRMSSSLQNFTLHAPRGVATPGAFTRDGGQAG